MIQADRHRVRLMIRSIATKISERSHGDRVRIESSDEGDDPGELHGLPSARGRVNDAERDRSLGCDSR